MSETATCAKCAYTMRFPYTSGEMVKIFFDNHDCDSTKLQQAIERVRELLFIWDRCIRDCDCDVCPNYADQLREALDGEQ